MRFMDRINRFDTAPMGAVEALILNAAAILFGIASVVLLIITY